MHYKAKCNSWNDYYFILLSLPKAILQKRFYPLSNRLPVGEPGWTLHSGWPMIGNTWGNANIWQILFFILIFTEVFGRSSVDFSRLWKWVTKKNTSRFQGQIPGIPGTTHLTRGLPKKPRMREARLLHIPAIAWQQHASLWLISSRFQPGGLVKLSKFHSKGLQLSCQRSCFITASIMHPIPSTWEVWRYQFYLLPDAGLFHSLPDRNRVE